MGTDIHGWVEIKQIQAVAEDPSHPARWEGVIKIDNLIRRNYDMFSSLFGISSYAAFVPIAPARKLPHDLSEETTADYVTWEEILGETWISWAEIAAVDWTEDALDSRPHEYQASVTGQLNYTTKSAPLVSEVIQEGHTWHIDATTYKIERITRQQALSPDWTLLFQLMETLVSIYGENGVRLVVWFEN